MGILHFHTSDQREMPYCINVILHWLWNVNDIHTDISMCILLRHSANPSNCLMAGLNYCALYTATTNLILIMGLNL